MTSDRRTVVGRVGSDAEIRQLNNGPIAAFSLYHDVTKPQNGQGGEQIIFDVTVWPTNDRSSYQAPNFLNNVAASIKKGMTIKVTGTPKETLFQDKQTGQWRISHKLNVNNPTDIEFSGLAFGSFEYHKNPDDRGNQNQGGFNGGNGNGGNQNQGGFNGNQGQQGNGNQGGFNGNQGQQGNGNQGGFNGGNDQQNGQNFQNGNQGQQQGGFQNGGNQGGFNGNQGGSEGSWGNGSNF